MEPTWKPPGLVGETPIGQPGDITLADLLHFATPLTEGGEVMVTEVLERLRDA